MDRRRLSAIMFTDIVGYTRKMGDDEVRMLRLLKEHNSIIEAAVDNHEGEIIKRVGDAFLVRFISAQNAVLCAIEIQQLLSDYNKDKSSQDQVHIRIGIHLGDIVISEGDVFGDGVNVASRIEPLAHPDGICITRSIYDMVKKQMSVKAIELGPQQLKNIDETIEVFHLLSETVGIKELRKAKKFKRTRTSQFLPYTVIGVIAIIAIAFILKYYSVAPDGVNEIMQLVENAKTPSNKIAVMPFRNLTGNDQYQYICEGLAREVIYRLLPAKDLYLYPIENLIKLDEKNRNYEDVRNAFGADYLVSGTVEMQGDSLNIGIELIATNDGNRLFTHRYLSSIDSRIQAQDRIANDLLFQIVGRLENASESYAGLTSQDPRANDLFHQAMEIDPKRSIGIREGEKATVDRYLELLNMAIQIDSGFVNAYCHLARGYQMFSRQFYWYDDSTRQSFGERAEQLARIAVTRGPHLPEAHLTYAIMLLFSGDSLKLEQELRKAIELRPIYPLAIMALGSWYNYRNKHQEAEITYQSVLKIYREFGDRLSELEMTNTLVYFYLKTGEFTKVLKTRDEYVKLAQTVEFNSFDKQITIALLHARIAQERQRRREYSEAVKEYSPEVSIYKSMIDTMTPPQDIQGKHWITFMGAATTFRMLSENEIRIGDLNSAQSHIEEGIEIATSVNRPQTVNYYKAVLCHILRLKGDIQTAEELISRVIESGDKRTDIMRAFGLVLLEQSQYDRAQAYLDSALAKADERVNKSEIQCDIGAVHFYSGDMESAIIEFNNVLNDTTADIDTRLRAELFLGAIAAKNGNLDSGLQRANTALDSMIIHSDRVETHRVLGEVLLDLGRKDEAKQHLEVGRKVAEESGMKGEIKKFDELIVRLRET